MIKHWFQIVAAFALTSAVACSSPTDPPRVAPTSPSTAAIALTPSPPAATPEGEDRTANEDLAEFLDEARETNARLDQATTLIKAGIGIDTLRVDQATIDAVRAAAPDTAARAIPPGLEPELLRRTLVLYNDLSARHAAMGMFIGSPRTHPLAGDEEHLLRRLANGDLAAARFAADLASLQSLARTRPATTAATSQPDAAAELAVRLARIDERNNCSFQCGNNVYTNLEPLTWTIRPKAATTGRGELEGITFTATPQANGWVVVSDAC